MELEETSEYGGNQDGRDGDEGEEVPGDGGEGNFSGDFADDLFQPSVERWKLSRAQKRVERHAHGLERAQDQPDSRPLQRAEALAVLAEELPHAYRELGEMRAQGVIEPTSSDWAAPIVVVRKKDGSIRLCVDYRRLNAVSIVDAYPMPRIEDLIDYIGQAKFISTLDLTKGYWQVPVVEEDRGKTAFTTPFGLFQFRRMPFGLQGAPATFQRMMD